jgi:hypothetical protein
VARLWFRPLAVASLTFAMLMLAYAASAHFPSDFAFSWLAQLHA